MTMPHLMNCPHSPDGWCLDCVKELWDEKDKLEKELNTMLSISGLQKCSYCGYLSYDTEPFKKVLGQPNCKRCYLEYHNEPNISEMEDYDDTE